MDKLAQGEQQVEICTRAAPEDKRKDLVRQIGYDLVHVKFPNTQGGTEIGLRLQRELCDDLAIPSDPDQGPDTLKLVGDLTLDWVPIRVTAVVSLRTYTGTATVEKREAEESSFASTEKSEPLLH